MKKVFFLLLSLIMGGSLLLVPASAEESSIQPRGSLCTECNRGEVVKVDEYETPHIILESFNCQKDPTKKDLKMQYKVYITWKCTYCGSGDTLVTTHTYNSCTH